MKRVALSFLVSLVLLVSVSATAGKSRMSCVKLSTDGDVVTLKNECSYTVTVAYCSPDKAISGDRCGDNKHKSNPYYTHMRILKAGEFITKWKPGRINYAVCEGEINGWDPGDDFVSLRNGDYQCNN